MKIRIEILIQRKIELYNEFIVNTNVTGHNSFSRSYKKYPFEIFHIFSNIIAISNNTCETILLSILHS